ncbi:conserved hypothetical protein [Culex quinquefasciatus]|uniref:Uncharacterized protein n=1 Tax=Culex quinquefasciatus TaxID=7176 RepID=B0XFI9_CULQU|nr:conserved hypothetical protein [Culex quinquefasciatus]|eukprot:XP_001868411.1 conserved hypothetical protein [Culex quinquefasciatus]
MSLNTAHANNGVLIHAGEGPEFSKKLGQGCQIFKLINLFGRSFDYLSNRAMLRAASIAQRNAGSAPPPPYTPPGGGWYAAPPPAYTPNPYNYGWVPSNTVFPDQPAPNSIYMHDSPPPYPGIIATPAPPNYPPQGGYPQQQGGFQQQPGGYPTQPGYPPQQNGFGGYPPQQQNGGPSYGFAGAPGYSGAPSGAMGFVQQPPASV